MKIYDNKENIIDDEEFQKNENILQKYNGKKIKELSNLIAFPNLNDSKDNIGEQKLYDICKKYNKTCIKTANLAGFIRLDNKLDFRIQSRFGGQKDFFLQYMICKVFNVNISNLAYAISKSDELSDMALLLLPAYILRAHRKGLFRSYKSFKRNDDKVRGRIDLARHIKQNPLSNGKISYISREYSYDNHITQLIRHTVEYARTLEVGKALISPRIELSKALQEIEIATPSYTASRRKEIIIANKKPFSHPYYREYADLQKLCLMILSQKGLDFTSGSDESANGILFDTSWLWEEYMWSILGGLGFSHPNNRKKLGAINAFKEKNDDFYSFHYYPDFYKDNLALDAKYKNLFENIKEKSEFKQDFEKMLIYMFLLKAKNAVFVFPSQKNDEKTIKLNGYGDKISVYPFCVPQNSKDLKEFCEAITHQEDKLKEKLTLLANSRA